MHIAKEEYTAITGQTVLGITTVCCYLHVGICLISIVVYKFIEALAKQQISPSYWTLA